MTEREPLTASPSGERKCHCVLRHNPIPQELHRHHVWPLGEGGPDVSENLLWLCPTTHSNIHKLWRLYETHKGAPPYTIRRQYSIYARSIVDRGWLQKIEHTGVVSE